MSLIQYMKLVYSYQKKNIYEVSIKDKTYQNFEILTTKLIIKKIYDKIKN